MTSKPRSTSPAGDQGNITRCIDLGHIDAASRTEQQALARGSREYRGHTALFGGPSALDGSVPTDRFDVTTEQ